jgi:hypothetical protein
MHYSHPSKYWNRLHKASPDNIESVENSMLHWWSSDQHQSTELAIFQSPATASNLANLDMLTPLARPTLWLQISSRLGYPCTIPNQRLAHGAQTQRAHLEFLPRDSSPSLYPFQQTPPQATVPNATAGGRQKGQSGSDTISRPGRRCWHRVGIKLESTHNTQVFR